ncbi:MAG: glycosyltransferase family 2 protein [Patescibacteria group bacterium]|nr:glycosyltransferase family 2 protein [Patescibacteria group bacterium]MDD5172639.1 glycosyltransferase family 2 protein [Patescibacteria group bacterium]
MKTRLKLIIQIVTWNSEKFLKDCLDSIFYQTFKNFSLLIIDNGSTDRTLDIVKNYSQEKIKEKFGRNNKLFVFYNNKNIGYSRAHNQGFHLQKSEFVLILNPDVILEPDFLNQIIKVASKEKRTGSFGGKLLKIKSGDCECEEKIKTDILDSTGMRLFKNYHFIERGQGEKDQGQYDKQTNVFGITGACVLYRRVALEDVKIFKINIARLRSHQVRATAGAQFSNQIKNLEGIGEYFDEDFFAYQEDVDLAWRLQIAGWLSLYVPKARAYHYRGTGLKERPNLREIIKGHLSRPAQVEFFSYRNHLWLLLKNLQTRNFFSGFFWIFLYQLGKETYLFFTKPKVLFKGGISFFLGCGKMLKKRRMIMKQARVLPKEIKAWIQKSHFYH